MLSKWKIERWPRCLHHVFLSHCAENRQDLVVPVYERIARQKIIPWLDRHHYPSGRGSHEALRESLLRCRHVVYFVTPELLRQGESRGWCVLERGYGSVIQQALTDVGHVELPLFFVARTDPTLQRSVWSALTDQGVFFDSDSVKSNPVTWAVRQIADFIRREEVYAFEMLQNASQKDLPSREKNFLDRITAKDLPPLPSQKQSR